MSELPLVEETWVTTMEASQHTNYSRQYMIRLAHKMAQLPEEERQIKVRRRNGHELWLPDLLAYIEHLGRGPYTKKIPKE